MLRDFWITVEGLVMKITATSETEAYRIARQQAFGTSNDESRFTR